MEVVWRDESPTLKPGAVILSCFPSAGLATTVAAHYMVRSLKLARIGWFDAPDMMPIAVVQGGRVNPPVRVYGRADLAVILSEFPPSPSQATAFASTILAGAEARQAKWILGLEGVIPHPSDDEEAGTAEPPPEEKTWAAFSRQTPELARSFSQAGALALEDGVIGGVSGSLLVHGLAAALPVAVLLVSARATELYPDHRAGATLIEAVDRILPEVKIDTGPLRVQAEEIERALRARMRPPPASSPDRASPEPPASGEMYR